MNEPLILTMDLGTQSVRVALFDKRGFMVAMKKKDYDNPYFSLHPNWAEKSLMSTTRIFAFAPKNSLEKTHPR